MRILFLCLLFISQSYAAEFTANVSSNKVNYGQPLELRLILQDAEPLEPPDISELHEDFTVYSQQQYSSFSSVNLSNTKQNGWVIGIIPKKDGNITIPNILLKTNKGVLSTSTINLTVNKNSNAKNNNIGISLIATVNKNNPYVKEPVIYTLKIIGHRSWFNVILEDIKSNDAIIDKIGEAKQYREVVDGLLANIIEINYAITPLSAGKVKIYPATVTGEINNFGPFTQPFSVTGELIRLNAVAAPIKDQNTWLPLQNLILSEEWQGLNDVKVGDTITRKIKIEATGIFANQLPSVKQFMQVDNLKYYAKQPINEDNVNHLGQLVATKIEEFSLVAQKNGLIKLPEIKIYWWNLRTRRQEVSVLPEKVINVIGLSGKEAKQDAILDYSDPAEPEKIPTKHSKWIYIIFASMCATILILSIILILLLRNKSKPKHSEINVVTTKINSVVELRDQILLKANKEWGVIDNITISQLGAYLHHNGYKYDLVVYSELCSKINSSIYNIDKIDLSLLIDLWQKMQHSVRKDRKRKNKNSTLYSNIFNPT